MRIFVVILLGLLVSCQMVNPSNETLPLYQSFDWVGESFFTEGIEGPAVDAKGVLYAVNYAELGTIGAVESQGNVVKWLDLPEGSIANGIRFNKQGEMFLADYTGHNILKVSRNKAVSVHAHNPTMNQPNDLAIMDNGIIFASDPDWANETGNLWRILPTGETEQLYSEMGTTNGIEVNHDNSVLYVNESIQRRIWAFSLDKQGNIIDKKLFYQFDEYGLDGMRSDEKGNLYVARYGAGEVVMISSTGRLLKTVKLKGSFPTNVAFGGKDGKQVFVTMQKRGAVESFYAEFSGRAFNYLK